MTLDKIEAHARKEMSKKEILRQEKSLTRRNALEHSEAGKSEWRSFTEKNQGRGPSNDTSSITSNDSSYGGEDDVSSSATSQSDNQWMPQTGITFQLKKKVNKSGSATSTSPLKAPNSGFATLRQANTREGTCGVNQELEGLKRSDQKSRAAMKGAR